MRVTGHVGADAFVWRPMTYKVRVHLIVGTEAVEGGWRVSRRGDLSGE